MSAKISDAKQPLENQIAQLQEQLKAKDASAPVQVAEAKKPLEEKIAQTDYRLKVQAKNFWNFLAGVQEVRQGVRAARHKASG